MACLGWIRGYELTNRFGGLFRFDQLSLPLVNQFASLVGAGLIRGRKVSLEFKPLRDDLFQFYMQTLRVHFVPAGSDAACLSARLSLIANVILDLKGLPRDGSSSINGKMRVEIFREAHRESELESRKRSGVAPLSQSGQLLFSRS